MAPDETSAAGRSASQKAGRRMSLCCARCDWRGEDDEAEEHARETGHPRCVVCRRRSLTLFEAQTCGDCVGRVRADLADIVQAWCELEPATVEALTLLGDGTMQRLMRADELASLRPDPHPLAKDDDKPPRPIRDEWANDPLPMIATLASWEDFIREHYREPKGPADPTLTQVTGYLMGNLDTGLNAAQTFPAFDEFAEVVRHLRSAATHAAGIANDPLMASTACFDCGAPLIREYRGEPRLDDVIRKGLDFEGLSDEWRCRACSRVYTPAEYMLAVRAELEARAS